jgi:hypothetical protein
MGSVEGLAREVAQERLAQSFWIAFSEVVIIVRMLIRRG